MYFFLCFNCKEKSVVCSFKKCNSWLTLLFAQLPTYMVIFSIFKHAEIIGVGSGSRSGKNNSGFRRLYARMAKCCTLNRWLLLMARMPLCLRCHGPPLTSPSQQEGIIKIIKPKRKLIQSWAKCRFSAPLFPESLCSVTNVPLFLLCVHCTQ